MFVLFVFFATLNAFTAHHIGWDSSHRIHHEQHTVNFGAGTHLKLPKKVCVLHKQNLLKEPGFFFVLPSYKILTSDVCSPINAFI